MNLTPAGRFGEGSRPAMLFALAAAARVIYLLVYHPPLESYYLALADNLLNTGVLGFGERPSTSFEPLYPSFLAGARLLFGEHTVLIQLLQTIVSATGTVLVYYLSLHLSVSRTAATAGGALFALHPLLIRQASSASDLAMSTILLLAFALAFIRIRDGRTAAFAGLMLGLSVLTRSMVLPVVVFAAAILMSKRQLREAAVLTIVTGVVVTPMAVRNYAVGGSPLPGRSGINLYIGNSQYTDALLPTYDLDLLEPDAYERFVHARSDVARDDPRTEAEFDAFVTRQAVTFMRDYPWRTLRQKFLNVTYLFSPRIVPFEISGRHTRVRIERNTVSVENSVPRRHSEITAHALASLLLLVAGAAGVYLRRAEFHRDAILWAIAGTCVAVNVIYVPATRYTGPIQCVLIFYSAVALARLREGLERRFVTAVS